MTDPHVTPQQSNPYSPPAEVPASEPPSPERLQARRQLRISLVILLLPALHNYLCYDAQRSVSLGPDFSILQRSFDGVAISFLGLVIWFGGLPLLEGATRIIHRLFSRGAAIADWRAALYSILSNMPYFALVGAVLWFTWNVFYYNLGFNFYAISVPIGIAAHLLAAGLYLRLFFQWFQIERRSNMS